MKSSIFWDIVNCIELFMKESDHKEETGVDERITLNK
jgi:hypothetical protein